MRARRNGTQSKRSEICSRWRFINIGTVALGSGPFAGVLFSGAATAAEALTESDPTVSALGLDQESGRAQALHLDL